MLEVSWGMLVWRDAGTFLKVLDKRGAGGGTGSALLNGGWGGGRREGLFGFLVYCTSSVLSSMFESHSSERLFLPKLYSHFKSDKSA